MKTTDKIFAGWEIVTPGDYRSSRSVLRFRVDRFMRDQSPPVEYEGHFDTLDAAVRHGNTFDVNNADEIRVRDVREDNLIAKRVFS
jgi:hypothetical protein